MESERFGKVKVELELTPRWWGWLTRELGSRNPKLPQMSQLHAQCVNAAVLEFTPTVDLKTTRSHFLATVFVPRDTSLERLCEKAARVVEQLNALDVSCLDIPERTRAKYL